MGPRVPLGLVLATTPQGGVAVQVLLAVPLLMGQQISFPRSFTFCFSACTEHSTIERQTLCWCVCLQAEIAHGLHYALQAAAIKASYPQQDSMGLAVQQGGSWVHATVAPAPHTLLQADTAVVDLNTDVAHNVMAGGGSQAPHTPVQNLVSMDSHDVSRHHH